ncbi:MAG: FecR domain-containing protein [Niastella sp.]|nr:FecR domain-containing protein [Niastella sp.]
MNEDRLKYLLERYQANECSPEEQAELDEWFHAWNPGTANMRNWLQEAGSAEALTEELYADFKERVAPPAKRKGVAVWYKVAAAAAVLIVLLIVFYPKQHGGGELAHTDKNKQATRPVHDIKPGSNKAVLKLADGSEIVLSDSGNAHIATQNNTEIQRLQSGGIGYQAVQDLTDDQPPVYNTLTTPRGGKFTLTLSDGTVVTLDAASSITYPVVFKGRERRVQINGQAYFDVVHNAAKPFHVEAKGQLIEDLGTAFNVNAYSDDPFIKVTLVEGLVDVSNDMEKVSLVPGQQAMVKDGESKMRVKVVNVAETVAWKNGWFIFHQENLQNIMKQAGRWYDAEIVLDPAIMNKKLGGNISRYKDISELLENLKLTGGIDYKIEGQKVTLTKR